MGPFVPDLISDQLNLVVALLLGIGFGFVLEQAGFSSSRRLAGVFYGYDFTVLRVFFTAAITAMSGVLLLGYWGLLDTDAIFVNPTWLMPAIAGGVIMGAGFILGGYCPGTSICAAAIGKVDALYFIGGGLAGVFLFGELYPLYKNFNESTALGPVKVFSSLGIGQGQFAFLLILAALGAFAVTSLIEKKVAPKSAPSLAFRTRKHILAGVGICLLGALFLILPDRKEHLLGKASDPSYLSSHPVSIMSEDELAFRIIDREPGMQVVDIRSAAEYAGYHLPSALNIPVTEFFSKEWEPVFSRRYVKKVIIGTSEEEEIRACLLLHLLGYENTAAVHGGIPSFNSLIMTPAAGGIQTVRLNSDEIRFREKARREIGQMIEEGKKTVVTGPRKEKKIQGGC